MCIHMAHVAFVTFKAKFHHNYRLQQRQDASASLMAAGEAGGVFIHCTPPCSIRRLLGKLGHDCNRTCSTSHKRGLRLVLLCACALQACGLSRSSHLLLLGLPLGRGHAAPCGSPGQQLGPWPPR